MHDTLGYFQQDPIYRRYHHHELTFSLMYAFSENFILPLSHDEVVHGKGSLLREDGRATAGRSSPTCARSTPTCGRTRARSSCSWAASWRRRHEWSHERSLDWHLLERPEHAGIQALVRDLNRAYRDEPALWELDFDPSGFYWLEPNDADSNVVAFARALARTASGVLVFVANLSPVARGRLPARAAARRRAGASCSTPTRRSTAAATSGNLRRGRARADPVARPAVLGRAHAAAARGVWLVPDAD